MTEKFEKNSAWDYVEIGFGGRYAEDDTPQSEDSDDWDSDDSDDWNETNMEAETTTITEEMWESYDFSQRVAIGSSLMLFLF